MNCIYCGCEMFERFFVGIPFVKKNSFVIYNYDNCIKKHTFLLGSKLLEKVLHFVQHKNFYPNTIVYKKGFKCHKCRYMILSHVPIKNKEIDLRSKPKFGKVKIIKK